MRMYIYIIKQTQICVISLADLERRFWLPFYRHFTPYRYILVNNTLVFSREAIKIQQVHCRLFVNMSLFRFAEV